MMSSTAPSAQPPISSVRRWRGPFTRWPRAADTALAILVFLLTVFIAEASDGSLVLRPAGDVTIAAYLAFAVSSGALFWRRGRPLEVLGVALVASALSMGLGEGPVGALVFALYSAGRYASDDRWSLAGAAVAIALEALNGLVTTEPPSDIGVNAFVIFLVWYVGTRIRLRGERAALLAREQAAAAHRVVAEERARIARELHDVVAHRVSLMTVQAGAAKTVAANDPESAVKAMEAVEQTGRQALDELRHLLGILRPAAEPDELGPPLGLADIPGLVDEFRAAGLDVSLTMDDARTDLPARVDLSTYRIVQEALTNVLRHAGPGARTEVRLGTNGHQVDIEVRDDGRGGTITPGSGHGIVGMRERALLLGGSFQAGPRAGRGFRVVARLPIGEETA